MGKVKYPTRKTLIGPLDAVTPTPTSDALILPADPAHPFTHVMIQVS